MVSPGFLGVLLVAGFSVEWYRSSSSNCGESDDPKVYCLKGQLNKVF